MNFELELDPLAAKAYLDHALSQARNHLSSGGALQASPIGLVGVIGAGTMGCGIAISLANAGIPVILNDISAAAADKGIRRIQAVYASSVARGRITDLDAGRRMALITPSGELQNLRACELVIEAVYEDMALKCSIFEQLDEIVAPAALLCTNTSGLDIDAIAASTKNPQRVIGAHFFSPAHIQKLLEIVVGQHTSEVAVRRLVELSQRIGKVSVIARNYPGFIGNALFRQYIREAHFLVEEGALAHEVDAAMESFGFSMGVFAVHDLAGNDVGWQTRKREIATRNQDRRWNDLILELCDMGRFGQKAGKGWYIYREGSRIPERDPELEQFIVARSYALGITRRPVGRQEILERCLLSMVNEAANLIDAGVAQRATDIDLVLRTGYGFPAMRGGLLYYADQIGTRAVLDRIRHYHDIHGVWWKPSPYLERLAQNNGSFFDPLVQSERLTPTNSRS